MEQVPQQHLDALRNSHGDMGGVVRALKAVPQTQYIPTEDLVNAVRSLPTDITYPDGSEPNGYVFGSAKINKSEDVPYQKYTKQLVETQDKFATIADTRAHQLIENFNVKGHLTKSLVAEGSDLRPEDVLNGYMEDGTRQPGLWDDISRGFAENARGDIITVTPHASPNRIFVQTELPALLDNPNVNTINGLPRQTYVDRLDEIVKALPEGAPMSDAFARLNKNFVQHTSESFMRKFSAIEFAHDMGGKDLPRDFLRAHENLKPVLDSAEPPKTSMLRAGFNVASEFLDPIKPGLKTFGYAVVGSIPIIGMLPNTAEAAELNEKLNTAIANGQISQGAIAEYNVILAGHVAQGADPTVVMGEAAIQKSFDDWADRYNVQGELRDSLQPSSLALMMADGSAYIAQNIERLPSATVDVGVFAGQSALSAGAMGIDALDDTYDYLSGNTAQMQDVYDSLPSVDLQEISAGALSGDHATFNERGDILDLLQIKAKAEYFEGKLATETDIDKRDYYADRLQATHDDFEVSIEAMDEAQVGSVQDYLAGYHQYQNGTANDSVIPSTPEESTGSYDASSLNTMPMLSVAKM